jgi:hypothetical protein
VSGQQLENLSELEKMYVLTRLDTNVSQKTCQSLQKSSLSLPLIASNRKHPGGFLFYTSRIPIPTHSTARLRYAFARIMFLIFISARGQPAARLGWVVRDALML